MMKQDLVELKILLPDRKLCSIRIDKNSNTDQVYKSLVESIKLDAQLVNFFYLFEVIDQSFGKFKKSILVSSFFLRDPIHLF